jgi:DNA-binding PadR family transcriptional regulator
MNDLLLLATLLPGPQHGYALKKQAGLITGQRAMHNNLVYPLLKRFMNEGWVHRKQVAGERGQTRELYALTPAGRQELVRKLSEFTEKQAASPDAFRLRVGLFSILRPDARHRILDAREKWLTARETSLAKLVGAIRLKGWGGEVVSFLRGQIRVEKKWLAKLRKNLARERAH